MEASDRGKHVGTIMSEVCKVTSEDSEVGGHTKETEFTKYDAGIRHCRYINTEFTALK